MINSKISEENIPTKNLPIAVPRRGMVSIPFIGVFNGILSSSPEFIKRIEVKTPSDNPDFPIIFIRRIHLTNENHKYGIYLLEHEYNFLIDAFGYHDYQYVPKEFGPEHRHLKISPKMDNEGNFQLVNIHQKANGKNRYLKLDEAEITTLRHWYGSMDKFLIRVPGKEPTGLFGSWIPKTAPSEDKANISLDLKDKKPIETEAAENHMESEAWESPIDPKALVNPFQPKAMKKPLFSSEPVEDKNDPRLELKDGVHMNCLCMRSNCHL